MISLKSVRNGVVVAALATFSVPQAAYAGSCFSYGGCQTCYNATYNGQQWCNYWSSTCNGQQNGGFNCHS